MYLLGARELCKHLVVSHVFHEVILTIAHRADSRVDVGSPVASVLRDDTVVAVLVVVNLHTLEADGVELTKRREEDIGIISIRAERLEVKNLVDLIARAVRLCGLHVNIGRIEGRWRVVSSEVERVGNIRSAWCGTILVANTDCNEIPGKAILRQLLVELIHRLEELGTLSTNISLCKNILCNANILFLLDNTLHHHGKVTNVRLVNDIIRKLEVFVAMSRETSLEASLEKNTRCHQVRLEWTEDEDVLATSSENIALCHLAGDQHKVIGIHGIDLDTLLSVLEDGKFANLTLTGEKVAGLVDEINIKWARLENLGSTEGNQVLWAILEIGRGTRTLAVKLDLCRGTIVQ